MTKTALITGITGQDGSYLAELLLSKGYEVHGLVRRLSIPNTSRIEHILPNVALVEGDLTDQSSLNNIMHDISFDEVYNLASQSFVGTSWKQAVLTGNVTGLGATRLLESIRQTGHGHEKIFQASTSEMFGKVQEVPQSESTKFYPRNPYACAKMYAHNMCINYRESYNMHIANGIMFNHESERRGIEFVTKKITDGVAKVKCGIQTHLTLGSLEPKRDWGYAKDYVKAMWLMLQQDQPKDYVIATGETHSIQEFVELAFDIVGLNWRDHIKQDPKFMRPSETDYLKGNPSLIKKDIGWEPNVKFNELVKIMVDYDVKRISDLK